MSIILSVNECSKRFGKTIALERFSLEIGQSESIGLVGQNGAGKSTLTKILVGIVSADTGSLNYRGTPFAPKNPIDAARKGISIVYQESSVIPDLKVFQWMYLGRELGNAAIVNNIEMKKRSARVLKELQIGCSIEDRLRDLRPVHRKMVEIAKAILIFREAQAKPDAKPILILDEPTAALTDQEKDTLFEKVRELKSTCSFLIISHFISEILSISDRVYVIRDGRNAGTFDITKGGVTDLMIHQSMFQREIDNSPALTAAEAGEPLLVVKDIAKKSVFHNVSFTLHKGEIVGLFGKATSGKSEIARSVAGIISPESGTIELSGKPIAQSMSARIKNGVCFLSGERSEEIYEAWTMTKNLTITSLDSLQKRVGPIPLIDFREEHLLALDMIRTLSINPPNGEAPVNNLSGGNTRKVVLGKWFARDFLILILENPTIGIDANTKSEVHRMIRNLESKGKTLLVVTDDTEEIRNLCSRVLLIENGTVARVYSRQEFAELAE